ncbi:sel1 repeat family protein [Pontibacter sp. Tf4]|nr:sel1 repeat family protein [Pontibacter sp. Tf4]
MMMAYGNGDGVVQDFDKAFLYALKCANNGDGTCMFNVINCYKEGTGTEKNLSKMLDWAIRLGKLVNPEDLQKSGYITSARLNLAYMYRDGIDVEQNSFMSYLWFILYNESKRDFSYFQQQAIVDEIKELEKSLTAKQKKSGKEEAEKLVGRALNNFSNLYKAEM